MAASKQKNVVFIIDQYDKLDLVSSKWMYEILIRIANRTILVSTNTDKQIFRYKDSAIQCSPPLILSESENLIPKEEMIEIIKKLFETESKDIAESVFEQTQGNLSLMFLFNKHCAGKKFMGKNTFELMNEYEDFAKKYSEDHGNKHLEWRTQKIEPHAVHFNRLNELMMFVDLDYNISGLKIFYLDERYLLLKDNVLIKSINPLISKMFRELYWNPNMIEKFLNLHGKNISGSTFGGMFEYYMISKIKELKETIDLQIKLKKNTTISFFYENISKVTHSDSYQKIEYHQFNGNDSVFYQTSQQNFPLFDILIRKEKTAYMVNLRINKENTFEESFNKYFATYRDQTKEQLSQLKNILKQFFFFIIRCGGMLRYKSGVQ